MTKHEVEVPSIKSKRADGKEVTYRIKEIENGFVITQDISYKDAKDMHHYESKEYFVETNPIAKQADNMYSIIENALDSETEISL